MLDEKKREPLQTDSLAELGNTFEPKKDDDIQETDKKKIEETASNTGFTSREPESTMKPRNKYVEPFSVKMRVGMPDIIEDIAVKVKKTEGKKVTNQELQERFIKAYLKEQAMMDLIVEFDKIVEDR